MKYELSKMFELKLNFDNNENIENIENVDKLNINIVNNVDLDETPDNVEEEMIFKGRNSKYPKRVFFI